MELMDDSWRGSSKSQVYQLGKTVNFQVSAPNLPTDWKLYISSCYATPASGFKSSLKYTIIDNLGCMMDSWRYPGASQFISRTDKTLRFSLKAFQFTSDPDTEVSIHCKLFVTSEDPSPTHKSCTYKEERWKALTGDNFICECCDSQCVTSEPIRATMEGSASIGSLLVSDQPYTTKDDFLPVRTSSVSRGGEAIISHYIDELNRYKDLLESVDVVQYDDDDDDEDRVYTDEDGEEEGGAILGELTEPDFEELGLREVLEEEEKDSTENYSTLFEGEGSGNLDREDYSESEEGREDEISDVQQAIHQHEKEAEVLRHWVELEQTLSTEASVQRELRQPQEDEVGNRMYPGREEEEDRIVDSEVEWKREGGLVDDREQTWYFSWR
ncbi:zona pellucida sperm-binding protein 3-like [Tautogolabrus adspersus]